MRETFRSTGFIFTGCKFICVHLHCRNSLLCGTYAGIDEDFATFQITPNGCKFMNFTGKCKKDIVSQTENGIQVFTSHQGRFLH